MGESRAGGPGGGRRKRKRPATPPGSPADLLHAAALLVRLGQVVREVEIRAVLGARARGATWQEVADALGLAGRSGAQRRYGAVAPPSSDLDDLIRLVADVQTWWQGSS